MHIWKRGENLKFSEHFNSNEFECPCGCNDQIIDEELIERLEDLRMGVGPIKITSGYRCAAHQQALKLQGYETAVGVSQHELGEAADITASMPTDDLAEAAKKVFMAVGLARSFVHVDIRSDKVRYWIYAKL